MSEHWKSTPRYWCKHCATYVRDTKLERLNHEATGKHQGAVKRSLRDLHRTKEHEDRDKERAKREIERLNGVVSGTPRSSGASGPSSSFSGGASRGNMSESERQRQAEQLASLGVSVPQQFRGEMAMAGEWTVTSTTVVEEKPRQSEDDMNPEARARGVRKRERTDEEKEEEDAIKSLFKKPRRWGRDSKIAGGDADQDLDALLSGGLVVKKKEEEEEKEEGEDLKKAVDGSAGKTEEDPVGESVGMADAGEDDTKQEHVSAENVPAIKEEPADGLDAIPTAEAQTGSDAQETPGLSETPVVAFKKRKPKNIRQK
ncbi:hypothetical protein BD289DRAFT_437083 [Coniella lustricola]|uniref:U1-C C2H2-type zinc finger domain-containing protein n=1 Tax=Coniella lustricola TaxID=2025994 RepID=A0A2T3A4C6_9PEZI|nr:hypothetical protein BD289DRAFT_437083 [Coniella lustricola]